MSALPMKCKPAFSLLEAVACIAVMGLLFAFAVHLLMSAMQCARDCGNPLAQTKAMRALSVMDGWAKEASYIRPIEGPDEFDPEKFDGLSVPPEKASALAFKINGENGALYRAMEVSGNSFAIHRWERDGGGKYVHTREENRALALSGKLYRTDIAQIKFFEADALEQSVYALLPSGAEICLKFVGKVGL